MTNLEDLARVPDGALTEKLYRLSGDERSIIVEQIIYLAEMQRRELHVELGFKSLFSFCQQYLGYSNATSFRRSKAASLVLRFPSVIDWLRDGRLSVTHLVELRDVLCQEKLDEILGRAAGRTEDEVKVLVAALQPSEPPPDLFRRLPARDVSSSAGTSPCPPAPAAASAPAPSPPPKLEPISAELRVLRITVGNEFFDDLEKVKAALDYEVTQGGLASVLHTCVKVTLQVCERRRRGTGRAQRRPSRAAGRYVPAAVRDAVWRRDESCCAYVGPTGIRCSATERLEVHHIVPYARGGEATLENLALRCRVHNFHDAVKDFGAEHMARTIERATR